ncbi:MAG: hypothetical protein WCO60_20015 [Verrucomicrobiota bacterium]
MSTSTLKKEPKLTGKQIWEAQKAKEDRDALIQPLWDRSEDILSILRRTTPTVSGVSDEAKERWYQRTQLVPKAPRSFDLQDDQAATPENWFTLRFPVEARRYGAPFLFQSVVNGLSHHALRPQLLNEDFFAAMLGGEKGLGHQIVYCPGDGFWFWDPAVEAFCPTTDAKMEILMSNYLVKYGEAFGTGLDVMFLYDKHRKPAVLKRVVAKAMAILEADESFFQGALGQPRYVEGKRVLPQPVASPLSFIVSAVTRQEGSTITASEAYLAYSRYCERSGQLKVTLTEFKSLLNGPLYDRFQSRLRHDIPTDDGRQTHGWKNVTLVPNVITEETVAA